MCYYYTFADITEVKKLAQRHAANKVLRLTREATLFVSSPLILTTYEVI